MTAVKDPGPLTYNVPITDGNGRPSPEFQRRWNTQRVNSNLITTITYGTGAPTGTPEETFYFDTSTTPYTLYVKGQDDTWHKADHTKFTELSDAPSTYSGAGTKLVRVNSGATALEFVTQSSELDTIGSTSGSLVYRGASNWVALTPGSNGQILTLTAGLPVWAAAPATGVTSVSSANGDLTVVNGTTTPVLTINSAPKLDTARTIAMSGDVVWSLNFDGSGNVTAAGTIQANAVTTSKINNSAVTLAKIANAAANSKLLGSGASGSGAAYSEISLGTGLSMVSTTLTPAVGSAAQLGIVQVDGTTITATAGVLSAVGVTTPFFPPQGRLTLVTGVPVMTSDQTAKGTIYWTPYVGNNAPIWNGSSWTILAAASDVTYTLSASAHTSGNLYDLFLYNNSGSLALGTSAAWTNSTTRSNAIAMLSGIWTNNATITLTVSGGGSTTSISANQATYVGTFYATANGQTGMMFNPAAAAGGSKNILGLYNAYNHVTVSSIERDSTSSWTNTSPGWRAQDNNTNNQVSFVDGLQQSFIRADHTVGANTTNGGAAWPAIGINLDSTSAVPHSIAQTNDTVSQGLAITDSFSPVLGFHTVYPVESTGNNTGVTVNFFGQPYGILRVQLEM